MSPRRLSMRARADAVARTRDAIVAAARDLHAERGLAATSWEDIAERAGVSTATVYRHFSSTSEVVPACARTVFDLIQPPTLEQASATFGSSVLAGDWFEQLVRLRIIEDSLQVLVTAAAGRRLSKSDHAVLFVLCNFPLWWPLTVTGLPARVVEDALVRLARAEVDRIGMDAGPADP